MKLAEHSVSGPHVNWAPGIGDPTFGGWLTVALYFVAAIGYWITLRKLNVAV